MHWYFGSGMFVALRDTAAWIQEDWDLNQMTVYINKKSLKDCSWSRGAEIRACSWTIHAKHEEKEDSTPVP